MDAREVVRRHGAAATARDWQAEPVRVIAQDNAVVTMIDARTPGGVETGIGIFAVAGGRIIRRTDDWPAPYHPPPRLSAFVENT